MDASFSPRTPSREQLIVRLLGASQITTRKYFNAWGWGWMAQTTFGSILAVVLMSLGATAGNIISFMYLILNLVASTGILPLELMPPFFQIGLGLPMLNAAQARY